MTSAAQSIPEPAELVLVCEEPRRGQALLAHLARDGEILRALDERRLTGRVVFWVQRPVRWPTLMAQLRAASGARVAVICHPGQAATIELALREGATVLTSPDPQVPLADKLGRWLERPDEGRTVEPAELARHMTRALERRLRRPSPAVRVADTARVEALAEKLAAQVLREARGLDAAPRLALDWENETTAVQSRDEAVRFRQLAAAGATEPPVDAAPEEPAHEPSGMRPRPEPTDLEHRETDAYDQPSRRLGLRVDPLLDEALTVPDTGPPRRVEPRREGVSPLLVIAVMCLTASVGGFSATMAFQDRVRAMLGSSEVAAAASPPRAGETVASPTPPSRSPLRAQETEPPTAAPGARGALAATAPEPDTDRSASEPSSPASSLPPAPTRAERAERAYGLAVHHQTHGRLGRARAHARRASRLVPDDPRAQALLAQIEVELHALADEDTPPLTASEPPTPSDPMSSEPSADRSLEAVPSP